jgi:ABC-2 type transport system ATP-binding protein
MPITLLTALFAMLGCEDNSLGIALNVVTTYDLAIQATQISRHFGDLKAIDKLDLNIDKNRIYGVSGEAQKIRINELLSIYGLNPKQQQIVGSMSGGQRQRLALAAATLHKPELLFLDEPTSAVDPGNRRDFREQLFDLCDQGSSILVSTHYMVEAERCHKLAILEYGIKHADGTPE